MGQDINIRTIQSFPRHIRYSTMEFYAYTAMGNLRDESQLISGCLSLIDITDDHERISKSMEALSW